MLTQKKEEELTALIQHSLRVAKMHWEREGHHLIAEDADKVLNVKMESREHSNYPGVPELGHSETGRKEYVALVADIRKSSERLKTKAGEIHGLQRVFYETSMFLPSIAFAVDENGGRVVEYLGDGALALFEVGNNKMIDVAQQARQAAELIIGKARAIINKELEKLKIPQLDAGVGLANSEVLITCVGPGKDWHVKAYGRCIYDASNLSGGVNKIAVDTAIESAWPTSKGGKLSFRRKKFGKVDGYIVNRH